ncbi:MAG: dTMP kinase [Thermoplasmata archaeon]|nr:dTMP kinase [Thermoplasmata archaeon]
MRGIFITFEGIDGCGKSTVSKQVASILQERGKEVYHTLEPSENWLGQAVRRSYTEEISPYTELFIFMADRATHTERIKKELSAGKTVISDRYCDSSTAYQGALLHEPLAEQGIDSVEWIMKMNKTIIREPDITLLLDISPEISLKRVEGRGELSKFEKQDYLEKVRANYLRIAKAESRIKIIDADQPVDKVLAEVMKAIEEIL